VPGRLKKWLARKAADLVELGEKTRPRTAGLGIERIGGEGTLAEYGRMRHDDQIALALFLIKAPLFSAQWWVESENEAAGEFVETELSRLWLRLVRTSLKAVEFGFAPHEKVWEVDGGRYVYDAIKDLDPRKTEILRDAGGHFAGLRYKGGDEPVDLSVAKSYVFTVEREFGDLYGISRLKPAWKVWKRSEKIYDATDRYYEKKADPPLKGRAPEGRVVVAGGAEKDNLDYMRDMAVALRNGGAVVFPVGAAPDGSPAWDIEYLTDDKRGDMFIQYLRHLDQAKMRACLVPDRVGTQGETGSYSQARQLTDNFLLGEDHLLSELFEHLQLYVVNPLVAVNFGDGVEVTLSHRSLSDDTKDLLREVVMKLLSGQVTAMEVVRLLDVPSILEVSDLPVVEAQEELSGEPDKLSLEYPSHRRLEVPASGADGRRRRAEAEAAALARSAGVWSELAAGVYGEARNKAAEAAAAGEEIAFVELPELAGLLSRAMYEADVRGRYLVARDAEARAALKGSAPKVQLAMGEVDVSAAVEYLKRKDVVTQAELDSLREIYEGHAFHISGVEEKALLVIVRNALARAVAEGTPPEDFVRVVEEAFVRHGVDSLSPAHIRTVFEANVHAAFHAARWQAYQAEAVREIFKAFMYVTMRDERVREAHAAMDGMVFAADDPIWLVWWPPNGYGCRCTTLALDRWELESGLYRISDSSLVSAVPDRGFAWNVGAEGLDKIAETAKGAALGDN